MNRFPAALVGVILLLGMSAAYAVLPDEIMSDPAKESRARNLSRELRCMVCQNQSIDDSEAPLARDLRLLVRERIAAGDSDAPAARAALGHGRLAVPAEHGELAKVHALAAVARGRLARVRGFITIQDTFHPLRQMSSSKRF